MAQVFRFDVGSLRKPVRTPAGMLKVDGWASRVGILEYRNPDGTTRRELRLPEAVFAAESLAGFEGLPITDGHPSDMVTANNATAVTRGTVLTPGRQDGDHVAVSAVVADARLIKDMESGEKRQLSVGYKVEIDETPGVHPQYGRYDAIQKSIEPNHLAVLKYGRSGPAASVRMDGYGSYACETGWLTTETDGHQHLIYDAQTAQSGTTANGSASDDEEYGHCHPWIRGTDGKIQIGLTNGHTHEAIEPGSAAAQVMAPPRADGLAPNLQVANRVPNYESTMTIEQALAELAKMTAERDAATKRADAAEAVATEAKIKAQVAEESEEKAVKKAKKAEEDKAKYEGEAAAARKDAEDAKAAAEKIRKDADDSVAALVKDRVAVETQANAILGAVDDKGAVIDRSAQTVRAIKCAIVKHVDGDDLADDKHDAYVDALYNRAVKAFQTGKTANEQTRAQIENGRKDGIENAQTGLSAEAKAAADYRQSLSNAWTKNSETK